uniref:Uncharacterized protein n=1 Tax=Cacopsylla melanoneura TaxID=428564 RepID=A0A8D8YK74_9HEMI
MVLAYFAMTTSDTYFLAYIFFTDHEQYRGKLGPKLYRIFSIIACMTRITFTVHLNESNKTQAKSGALNAHRMLMKNRKLPFKNQIMTFSCQQLHYSLPNESNEYFELSYSFLYKVICAIIMHLFFLLQFQLSMIPVKM